MPLVCRMSALTARPQRIPNLSQITYPSDSCSVMPVTIILLTMIYPCFNAVYVICSGCSKPTKSISQGRVVTSCGGCVSMVSWIVVVLL